MLTDQPAAPAVPAGAETLTFLRGLYHGATPPAHLVLNQFEPGKVLWLPGTDLPGIAQKAAELGAKRDTYFSCALQDPELAVRIAQGREDVTAEREQRSPRAVKLEQTRGCAESTCGIGGLWWEVDVAHAVHKHQNLPPTIEAACSLLETLALPPSAVVVSGHGLHAWWLLPELWQWPADHTQARQDAAALVQRWQAACAAQAHIRGWHVDSTHDLARVLRLPGTLNHRQPPAAPVQLRAWDPERRYTRAAILAAITKAEAVNNTRTNGTGYRERVAGSRTDTARDRQTIGAIVGAWPRTPEERQGHSRHDHLLRPLAGALARRTAEDHVIALLQAAVRQAGDSERDWDAEIRRLVENAAAKLRDDAQHVEGLPTLGEHFPELAEQLRVLWPTPALDFGPGGSPAPRADGDSSNPSAGLPFRTAREIAAATAAVPRWVAKPWAARGTITELDGKVKRGGKTTLLLHITAAVLRGKAFLGEPVQRTPIVYLTEQSSTSFREGLRRAHLLEEEDLHILCWPDVRGVAWEDLVKQAVSYAREVGAGLLIVDTLPQFAGVAGDGENSSGEALKAMGPLQAAAADGLAIIIARHERKSGGDVGDSGRGSSAFSGAVDTVVSIRRPSGDAHAGANVRILECLSRFDEVPETLAIELTADGYVSRGDTAAYAKAEAAALLPGRLPATAEKAQTADELIAGTGITRTVAYEVLAGLVEQGQAVRLGKGKKGNPFRFHSSAIEIEHADESEEPASDPPVSTAAPIHSSATRPDADESERPADIHSSASLILKDADESGEGPAGSRLYPCPGCGKQIPVDWEDCTSCNPNWRAAQEAAR